MGWPLGYGDVLFMPAKTWHYVRAVEGPSLSVSYWGGDSAIRQMMTKEWMGLEGEGSCVGGCYDIGWGGYRVRNTTSYIVIMTGLTFVVAERYS